MAKKNAPLFLVKLNPDLRIIANPLALGASIEPEYGLTDSTMALPMIQLVYQDQMPKVPGRPLPAPHLVRIALCDEVAARKMAIGLIDAANRLAKLKGKK